jgi:hypothetical protein
VKGLAWSVFISRIRIRFKEMLLTFVPGFSHPVLQVDASDKQGERLVLEMQLAVLRVRPLRPGEAPFFQPLAQDP